MTCSLVCLYVMKKSLNDPYNRFPGSYFQCGQSCVNPAHNLFYVSTQALLIAHDDICNKRYEEQFETYILSEPPPPVFSTAAEQVRFVNIHKSQNEPLVGIVVLMISVCF